MNHEIASRLAALNLPYHCGVDGLFTSEIAIIAEAPGERERQIKQPLVGSSGKILWEILRQYGINRRGVYISNVIKRQLSKTEDDKSGIDSTEADHYAGVLQWELRQLPNLKFIVVLGNYALQAVTGYSGITNHRGSVYEVQIKSMDKEQVRTVTCICMNNPAAVIHNKSLEVLFRFDAGRMDDVINGRFKQHIVSPIINPSAKEALEYIDRMQDENLPVALDIETISSETACVGLANNRNSGMCINFRDRSSNRYSLSEESQIRLRLQRFVSDKATRLIMQNGMFDTYWLACKDRIMLGKSYFDTMLAHHTLYPTLPHNLGFITSQYTTHPFYKDEGKEWREGGDINSFWEYNVKDCCITWTAHEKMLKELENRKLTDFFFSHVMRLQPHLIRMVVGGVKCDVDLKSKIAAELKEDVSRLLADFHRQVAICTGDEDYKPNPGSPKQLRELYFSRLRLVGRGVATDVKNRVRMRSHPKTTDEQKALLIAQDKFATEKKFSSTYAEMVIDEDSRVRCEYKQTGVVSAPGRLSSSSVMWGSGANLQNQPGRAQKMYIADPGYEFNYFDLSQAEARVVAYRAVIHKWIEDFERARLEGGFDCHRALASDMYKIPYDQVPTNDWEDDEVTPTIRYKSKRCRHGLNYTMGPGELSEQISVDYQEASQLHIIYHRTTPELQRWWNWQFNEVVKTREMFNAYGRPWISLQRIDTDILGTVVAFYPQSTIGDKVSRCIYLCESDDEWPSDARMLLNIHDALICINRPEDRNTVLRIMKKYAEEPLNILGKDNITRQLIIPAEFKTSKPDEHGIHRWSTLEKNKLEFMKAA